MTITIHSIKCRILELQDEFDSYASDQEEKIKALEADVKFYGNRMGEIAKLLGFNSSEDLLIGSEDDNETPADVLVRILKEKLANNQKE
jgi:hypothetical protein